MPITYTDNGGGAANGADLEFTFTFPVLQTEDVQVALNGVTQATTKYAVDTASNPTKITFNNTSVDSSVQESTGAPKSGVLVRVFRQTTVGKSTGDDDPKAVYAAGSSIRAVDLNANTEQALYAIHELQEQPIENPELQDGSVTSSKILDGTIVSGDIADGTIVNADINASAAIAGTKVNPAFGSQNVSTSGTLASGAQTVTGNIAVSGTVDGRDVATDGTKLDGIETAATADQTDAEIRTAVENATDSNVFTDADHTKLNGIETGATADQTAAEIRTLVESASDSNVFTDADHTKLNGIEASADVTDATNVNAAAAVMNSDLATKGQLIVGDGSGDPTILGDGQNNYVLVADSNEASGVKWGPAPSAGGLNNIVEDNSPQLGGALDVQAQEINTSTTNGNIKLTPNGTGKVEVKGNTNAGSIQLNCENNSHGVTIKGPAHSAAASYTLTLPNNIVNGQFLKTDTSGNLSWAAVDLTALSASNLTSGTVPDARFPATLPAVSGANLTNLDAADLASGTIPDARFPGTLPASSAANLTNIPAANITGTLPAISGANLTGINTDLVSDSSPQLGGSLDTNGNTITFGTGVGFSKKTGATNAVVNGITQHVKQNSLIIDGGVQDLFFTGGSSGSKITFGSSDGLTHEVMRITPSVLGVSQHGKVDLKYVTANAGGSTSSSTKLSTTSTGITVNGTVAATSYTGDGSNLTGVASTVAGGAIYENSQTISSTHTIPSGSNGMSAGPVSVSNGVTLTISSGSTYTVV